MTNSKTFPILIDNDTGIADDDNVYISIKATSDESKQCLVKIQGNLGSCESVNVNTNSSDYTYKLSDLPKNANGGYEFNLEQMSSARMYFSIKHSVDFYIDGSVPDNIAIIDPDGFKTRDSNYYTLYDKVEFSYVDGGLWINPTAVDFFSIPIRISLTEAETGKVQESGLSESRANILKKIHGTFSDAFQDKKINNLDSWEKLTLAFDKNAPESSTIRIMAPGKAMVSTGPGSNPVFPDDYLVNKEYGLNYVDHVWDYYSKDGHTIKIDCRELIGDQFFSRKLTDNKYVFEGHVTGNTFIFTNGVEEDQWANVNIDKPASIAFFAGAQSTLGFPNHTVGAIIARALTSAFIAGLLPVPDEDAVLGLSYFKSKHGSFYQDNPKIDEKDGGPWYGLYSKALHSFEGQPIYTFAYDDALGQDGTLHDPNANNIGKVKIILGDMTGTVIPDPYTDTSQYSVTFILGLNGNGAQYNLEYRGESIQGSKAFDGVTIPMHIKFNGQEYDIYIKNKIVLPYSTLTDGFVINQDGGADSLKYNIVFPGPPADATPEELAHQQHDEL